MSMCIYYYDFQVIESECNVSVECFNYHQESVQRLLVRRLYFIDDVVL
jgi:hypothetical protein